MSNPWAILDSVEANPARLHIATCMGAGMSLRAIAAAAGISATQASAINTGKRVTCLPQTRDAILSVRPGVTTDATPDTSEPFVPKIGTVRRIQALHALGWPHTAISAKAGVRTNCLPSQVGRWVTLSTHEAVARAYDELSATQGPSERTRGWARRFGYLPPAAWDDIDHDPAPLDGTEDDLDQDVDEVAIGRRMAGDKTVRLNATERDELVARWVRSGRPLRELKLTTGINGHRHLPQHESEAS